MERTRKNIRSIFAILLVMVLFVAAFTMPASARTTYTYRAVKVRNLSKELSKTPLATNQGQPGITLTINASRSVSRTYSSTANGGVKVADINASIGWTKSTTDSVTISNGGSWKVPYKSNNRNVKNGVLRAYCYYDRVEYKIQRQEINQTGGGRGGMRVTRGPWKDYQTGCIAKKARVNDIVFTRTLNYK